VVDNVALKNIEAIARIESAKMQHFYVGVEHLFIVLTKLEGGLTAAIFEQDEQSPRYLRYATRELAGRGDDRRYWPGYRTTPRAVSVLKRAQELIESKVQPDERALMLAILEDGDSIPVRVLQQAGVDIAALTDNVRNWSGKASAQVPQLPIDGGDSLSEDERLVLRQMFQKYDVVQIEHIFQEGFSGSTVMLVRPLHGDGRSDALVVVKIADRQPILWEKKRYDSFVKDTLPPTTARIEADPTLPDKSPLGGLKYTFVRLRGGDLPVNLLEYASNHDAEEVATFLREALYHGFRESWWGQAQPYRFAAWQEYEFLLPPAVVIEALPVTGSTSGDGTSRVLRPLDEWNRNGSLHPGDIVELENFTAQKVKRDSGVLKVSAGAAPEAINRASEIEVHGLDFSQKTYFRGEHIRKLTGRVLKTRDDLLQEQVQALDPNFNILSESLPYGSNPNEHLPNPMRRYVRALDHRISGTLSTIHGDLHTGNILIGPGGDAWLIDFEWTRDAHTLFDWAVLEVSLLIDHVSLSVGPTWDDAWQAIRLLDTFNRTGSLPEQSPLAHAFRPIVEIREIVSELLANHENWSEYQAPLAFCALRVLGWKNRPLTARRLAFLASALAMDAARVRNRTQTTQSVDLTDVTTDHSGPG
jgi:hypothetical protein